MNRIHKKYKDFAKASKMAPYLNSLMSSHSIPHLSCVSATAATTASSSWFCPFESNSGALKLASLMIKIKTFPPLTTEQGRRNSALFRLSLSPPHVSTKAFIWSATWKGPTQQRERTQPLTYFSLEGTLHQGVVCITWYQSQDTYMQKAKKLHPDKSRYFS